VASEVVDDEHHAERSLETDGGLKWRLRQIWDSHSRSEGTEITGFLGIWYMVDEAHIISVGVRRRCRSKGVGELLLIAAIEHAVARSAETMTLEVRPSNTAACNLYRKYGFNQRGLRKAYYSDNREDAIIMTTDSIQLPPFRQRFDGLVRDHQKRWGKANREVGT
jgi:ribosomal-protein-alanine N-acetyltransferase